MADIFELILEQIKELAEKVKNRAYSIPGEKINFLSFTEIENDENHTAIRKPFEDQLIVLCKTLSRIDIPSSHQLRVKIIIQNILDYWTNTFQDSENDFYFQLLCNLKEQGLTQLMDGHDPDNHVPRTAKEYLKHLLKSVEAS